MIAYRDLREYIEMVRKIGEYEEVKGISWDIELGKITDVLLHQRNTPMVMFDQISDYPEGFRVVVNFMGSFRRLAFLLGVENQGSVIDLVQFWKKKRISSRTRPVNFVKDNPVFENIRTGHNVNLFEFPVPKWHERDGGRYIGTASVTMTKDPETGVINLGTYRHQVLNKDTLGCFFNEPGRHALVHARKWHKSGKACPVIVIPGGDPLLFILSSMHLPDNMSELEVASGFRSEGISATYSDLTGLPVPTSAEIVIEGEIQPNDYMIEGPFGEWTGYYGAPAEERPVIRVKRIMFRNNPIILGYSPCRPPSNNQMLTSVQRSSVVWDALEAAGVPGVKGVWCHESGGGRLFNIIAIEQMYPGHARQAGLIASQCREAIRLGRYVVVTDDDIDITNLDEVAWAMSTRSDPKRSIEIITRTLGGELNTASPPEEAMYTSRAIIDACIPFEMKERFPSTCGIPKEEAELVKRKWRHLF